MTPNQRRRLTVRVTDEEWAGLKGRAVQERTTVQRLLEGAVTALVRGGQVVAVPRPSRVDNSRNIREPIPQPEVGETVTPRRPARLQAADPERPIPVVEDRAEADMCRRCDHRRRHHHPQRCNQMGCPCSRFLEATG